MSFAGRRDEVFGRESTRARARRDRDGGQRSVRPSALRGQRSASSPVTKSMSSSTRPSSAGSRSVQPLDGARMRRQPRTSAGLVRPAERGETPSFHGCPRGTTGHGSRPTVRAAPPATRPRRGGRRRARARGRRPARLRRRRPLLAPCHQVVDQNTEPAAWSRGHGADGAGRSSTPSSISTTTPSTRRSSPHTFSTSSASCRPSTRIREARAVRARALRTTTEPARRPGRPGRRGSRGREKPHRRAVDPEARPERERADLAAPVLEHDEVHAAALLRPQHRAHPAGLDVLDDQARLGGDLRQGPGRRAGGARGRHGGSGREAAVHVGDRSGRPRARAEPTPNGHAERTCRRRRAS